MTTQDACLGQCFELESALQNEQTVHGFLVTRREQLPEIEGFAYEMQHVASKAKLLFLSNDDENKAFSIAFRTPPENDTGVFHILEHSVLNGSDKFPVKEPFVNLLKGSMQTFLNAMTFPDKTMYPVASTNEQDLLNLMDVYLDAVFHPAIYHNKHIFEQEGWHYEVADDTTSNATIPDGALPQNNMPDQNGNTTNEALTNSCGLCINGVVYNEMKGALSNPESVLYDALSASLFPDTSYRFESGGTPQAIPTLSYEDFIEQHTRHYQPDNSYIHLYGNLNIDRVLAFLDERYLAPLAAHACQKPSPRKLRTQQPIVAQNVRIEIPTAPENACCGLGYCIGDACDHERLVAVDILMDALLGSNEAPLKRVLLDANLSDDVSSYLGDSVLQPFAIVQLRGSHPDALVQFQSIFTDAVQKLVEEGIDPRLIEASLAHSEFVMREHDFGTADGVVFAMASMAGWLYNDDASTMFVRFEQDYASLRKRLNTGFFEQLAREVFLENNHWASVELVATEQPSPNAEESYLAQLAQSMTSDQTKEIAQAVRELRAAQEAPDTQQALATLPHLGIQDISDAPHLFDWELIESTPVPCIRHYVPTRGIAYIYRYYDVSCIPFEELPYVSILTSVLGKLDTKHHSAAQIDTLVQGKLGNLGFTQCVFDNEDDIGSFAPKLIVPASALELQMPWLVSLPHEIMFETDFSDTAKIKDILIQKRALMERGFANAGHSAATSRLNSYYLTSSLVREQFSGIDFYQKLKTIIEHFDEQALGLSEHLEQLSKLIFAPENLTLAFTGSEESYQQFWDICAQKTQDMLTFLTPSRKLIVPRPQIKNEAFVVPTDIVYVSAGYNLSCLTANITQTLPSFQGGWSVASKALNFDYLWNEVRVKGGAYGVGFAASRTGGIRFHSYRDPHIDDTLERYNRTPQWLNQARPSTDEFEGYIVSTVAGLDTPRKPRDIASRQDSEYFTHRPANAHNKLREEAINATPDVLSELADAVEAALAQKAYCVFGSKDVIAREHTELNVVDVLGS